MLESVTLAAVVQLVVEVLVDLSACTVLDEKTAEDTKAAHPEYLLRHASVGSTLSLTIASMTALSPSKVQLTGSRS